MDFMDDKFVGEYSKKILAFAYNKTGNIYDAEDLSQEILISLFESIPKYAKIENMEGFVYTICCHCWSNFFRKNKKHWRNTGVNIEELHNISDDSDVQTEVENAVFIEKMKREIAYLSKLHRDIITMTYYDGKSSAQISKELDISDSTVRWHLVEIRKKLKVRIENMNNQNLNYKPVKLNAGWSGRSGSGIKGIGHYRLVDNICYVCYGNPLTIEEIAQKLSVASAFIEPHIDELVFMDYMKAAENNRYQTNFFIRTREFLEIETRYTYDNVKDKAGKLYDALEKRYSDIKAINFIGSDLDKDFLFWVLIPLLVKRLETKAMDIITRKKEHFYCMPKRKDGSEHWIRAFLQDDDYVSSLPEEAAEFGKKTNSRWCDPWIPDEIWSFQVLYYATEQIGGRNDLHGGALREISHIAAILRGDYDFTVDHVKFEGLYNEYDKTLMAQYAESGLVKIENGNKISMLIPVLKKDEYEKLDKILLGIETELGSDYFVGYIENYMKKAKEQVPGFLPENERNYAAADISCITALPYYLSGCGKLRYPTDEEAKRLGIIVWGINSKTE